MITGWLTDLRATASKSASPTCWTQAPAPAPVEAGPASWAAAVPAAEASWDRSIAPGRLKLSEVMAPFFRERAECPSRARARG